MKLQLAVQFVIATFVFSGALSAQAVTFGSITLGGKGCVNKTAELKELSKEDSSYSIAMNIKLNKSSGSLDRKACDATIPVKLEKDEKLIIENVSQKVSAEVQRGGTAKAQIEVFFAGQTSDVLKTEFTANSKKELTMNGVVAESACGGDVIVRANASAMAMGSGKVSLSQEELNLNLVVVKCAAGK